MTREELTYIGEKWLDTNSNLWRNGKNDEDFIVLLTDDVPAEVKEFIDSLNAGSRMINEIEIKETLF